MITNTESILNILNKELKKAIGQDETPVAALIVYNNKIISFAHNTRNKSNKTIDHAEIKAITKANKKLKNWRMTDCILYTTLEPCEMCKTVIKESRIKTAYYFLPRNQIKKQYNKTIFKKLQNQNIEIIKFTENYQKIIKKFWQNKR